MRRLIVVFLVLINFQSKANDFEWNPLLQKAYTSLWKLRLQETRALLASQKNTSGIKIYLQSYTDLIELMVTEDKADFEQFLDTQSSRLTLLEDFPDTSPEKQWIIAEMYLHLATAKLKFGHEVKGAWNLIKASKLLESNAKKFPNFIPQQKSLGLIHIMVGSIPQNFLWVAKLLGLKGSVKNGLQELKNVSKNEPRYAIEANIMYYLAHAYILGFTPLILQDYEQFLEKNDDSLLIQFLGVTTYMKEGNSSQASVLLKKCDALNAQAGYWAFPFLQYLHAEIEIQKGSYMLASRYYQMFLQQYKGFNFIKDTYYKLFLCFWLNNEDTKAITYFEKIKTQGSTIVEADQSALRFVEKFNVSVKNEAHKKLMKARLAFDGGYYQKAKELMTDLKENQFSLNTEKAEYNYRKGRVYQKLHEITLAEEHFEKAIVLSQNASISYGALACLQLGYIFQETKQKEKAKYYFEKVLTYSKHEYKNSADNKAKAALNTLN
ncbi:tetratricopeptide repeat protein [Flectobacillus roseus]|uniref:Tetratricopeptide repeat protein n=2 Tax=Bacteria TaxID=2 RepID=A0ABT6YBP5_9BACT|nr:tetratricopeptide repeat protein [Flectobacillus roseus]MDI9861007.1 tetratricopeptide repeat protein [Flectobacillus roseus]